MTSDEPAEAMRRFGAAVHARRRELRLTQAEVQERGGPSEPTQTGIENGTGPEPSLRTLKNLEKALQWPEGSAWRMLHNGEEPPPINDLPSPRLAADAGGPLRQLIEIRRMLDIVIDELRAE